MGLVHDTPWNSRSAGLGVIDQLVPSQISMSVSSVDVLLPEPTAMQLMALLQDTAVKPEPDVSFGLGVRVQGKARLQPSEVVARRPRARRCSRRKR